MSPNKQIHEAPQVYSLLFIVKYTSDESRAHLDELHVRVSLSDSFGMKSS